MNGEDHHRVATNVGSALGCNDELLARWGDGHSDRKRIGADGANHLHIGRAHDTDLAEVVYGRKKILPIG